MFYYSMDTNYNDFYAKCCRKFVLLLIVAGFCLGTPVAADEYQPLRVGRHLPQEQLADIKGNIYNLEWSSPESKITVFFFYNPSSPSCLLGLDYLNSLHQRTSGRGLQILAVESSGLSSIDITLFLEKYRRVYPELSYPIIPDPERRLNALFGVNKAPSVFLVERHGVIIFYKDEFREGEQIELAQKADKLLGIREEETRSVAATVTPASPSTNSSPEATGTKSAVAEKAEVQLAVLVVGDRCPAFTATDLGGKTRLWGDAANDGVVGVLFFWAANDLPSIQEMIFLDQIYRAFRDQGLAILAVETTGLNAETMAGVLKRYEKFYPYPSFPIIADPELRLSRLFGVAQGGQATYLIDTQGMISCRVSEFGENQRQELTRRFELALHQGPGALATIRDRVRESPAPPAAEQQEAPSIARSLQDQAFEKDLEKASQYFKLREFDKALVYYLRCLKVNERNLEIRRSIAKIYGHQRDLPNALGQWQEILKLDPADKEALSQAQHIIRQQQNVPGIQPMAYN